MFINNFKYKITRAKIIKIIYMHERMIKRKEYKYEIPKDDPFGIETSNIFTYDDDKEVTDWIYDYRLIIEYTYKNVKYQKEISLDGCWHYLKVNKKIKIYFERKNPNNVSVFSNLFFM